MLITGTVLTVLLITDVSRGSLLAFSSIFKYGLVGIAIKHVDKDLYIFVIVDFARMALSTSGRSVF